MFGNGVFSQNFLLKTTRVRCPTCRGRSAEHFWSPARYRSDVVEASYGRYKGEACAALGRGVRMIEDSGFALREEYGSVGRGEIKQGQRC